MRIAWVTPVHSRSAIGRFSRIVRAALEQAGHEVTTVRCGASEVLAADADPTGGASVPWTDLRDDPSLASDCDIFVYNAGDNFRFHAGIVELLKLLPGAIIFHDAHLLNLYLHYRRLAGHEPSPDPLLDQIHGDGTAAKVQGAIGQTDFLEATQSFPMTAWLARQADGAIAHAAFYHQRLREACAGPVKVIPLAFDSLGKFTPLKHRAATSAFRVLTFGHVNWNRRVDSVVRAIANSSALRELAQYRVVGPIEDREMQRLAAVAEEVGLKQIEFVGEVSDEALWAELEAADVLCGLRRPTLEGASATAIEGMLSGRPLLVSDSGFYRDLPDHLVFKVRAESELADIQKNLEHLCAHRSLGAETGEAAALWASQRFSARAYVEQLVPFLDRVVQVQPILRAAEGVSQNLIECFVKRGDPVVSRIAEQMERLFLPGGQPPVAVPPQSLA
jgi:glycosyltransferase involved in cell wall biosynthesis